MSERDELRAELRDIARRARALLDWMADSGTAGVPCEQGAATDSSRRETRTGQLSSHPSQPPVQRAERTPSRARERATSSPGAPLEERARADAAPRQSAAMPRETPAETSPLQAATQSERLARLARLEEQVRTCTRCPLHEHRRQTVFARGDPSAALCFVGEGPGAQEDAQGIPFVGPAGELLDRMINAMGYARDEVYICNIVKCRPPGNRKPVPAEMQACEPFLREQLELVEPEVLVALGATAVQGLLEWYDAGPHGPGITRLRGSWKVYRSRTPLMPTFHPAYLLRSPHKKRDVWNDLQAVMRRLGREPPARKGRGRS